MCRYFDPLVAKQCLEDDAEEVVEKERANFCEWFEPDPSAFDPARVSGEERAKNAAAALFGDADEESSVPDPALSDAEKLFK